ncbi:MAG: GGDEF domain-containing protein [Marichromatium sp.]|nr:GGDEF domain-containing protein [Marichromatium sp.]
MQKNQTTSILKNIFAVKIYLYTIISFFLIVITVLTLAQQVFIPSFKKQIINNVLDMTKRVAHHLSFSIDYSNSNIDEIDLIMQRKLKTFQIDKVHYLKKDGTIIYSTVKEKIGTVNKNSYFHNIVAKGDIYYKVIDKGGKSFENTTITKDIIEIYVPIMKNGSFTSAFEMYYDISKEIENFTSLSNTIMRTSIFACFLVAVILLVLIYNASKNNLNKNEYQRRLKILANSDSLTNLCNRRHFYEVAGNIINLAQLNKESISICMVDIDDFKNINDTYGHAAGDVVITTLTNEMKKNIRTSDIIARVGGEEFVILFPNTNLDTANTIANQICKRVSALEVEYETNKLKLTISIGVSELHANESLKDLIKKSDEALYEAKKTGKNRVVKFKK